jgi:geranylgeranyl diphosphate synthase, type I
MTQNKLMEQISEFRNLFETRLEKYFLEKNQESNGFSTEFQHLLTEVQRVTLLKGAKRLRPALAYFGYLSGIKNTENIENLDTFNLGIGLELFHSFALIHDDIIDMGLTRRGEPTIENHYREYFRSKIGEEKERNHYALSSSILAGDLALSLADQIINQISNEIVKKNYYKMQFELIAGQTDDCLGIGLTDFEHLTEEGIIKMLKHKSGNYSIQKPYLFGLMLSGCDVTNPDFIRLSEITEKLGLIFQFTDDIIGIFGNPDITGKSNISDIIEGKKTLLILKTYQSLNSVDQLRARSILGNKDYNKNDIQWIKEKITTTGAKQTIENLCQNYNLQIQNELNELLVKNNNNKGIQFLHNLNNYLINRNK